MLWKLNIPPVNESVHAAKQKAKQAAELLIQNHHCYGSVVLVAHGGINTLIAKELKKSGWQSFQKIDNRHWGYTEYVLVH